MVQFPGGQLPPDVLVVGEALVDVVHRADGSVDERPGGGPANVALSLARLDRGARLLTSLGADERGAAVRSWLEASGVVVDARPLVERTSTATARIGADGSAEYEFSISWALDAGGAAADLALHVGSISSVLGPGADEVSRLVDSHRGRCLLTYDPNIRPSLVDDPADTRSRVMSLIGRVDVVKASDEDVRWLHPGESLEAVARDWLTLGPRLVVITAGAHGALASTPHFKVAVPAALVEVVDTVGAGDTFMGALIDALLDEGAHGPRARDVLMSLSEERASSIVGVCAGAAAITVSRPGADPPTRRELAASWQTPPQG